MPCIWSICPVMDMQRPLPARRKNGEKMIENYLHTSKKLQAVFLLIDIRHDPSANDKMMYDWMVYQGFTPIIIATKA